jgi:cytochrome c biogenesis protein CcmG/thiol:disulfide interchange protein DsbE
VRLFAVVLALGTALVFAAACSREEMVARLEVGNAAPAFEALDITGDTVSLASLRGAPVLLNLWATWCHPCRTETPYLQSLHEKFSPRGLQVVGVSVDSPGALSDVRGFVTEFGVTYLVLHDPGMLSMDLFSAIGLPATYLIDADGKLIWSHLGPVDAGDRGLEQTLADALANGGR